TLYKLFPMDNEHIIQNRSLLSQSNILTSKMLTFLIDPIELLSSFKKKMRNKMARGTVIDEKDEYIMYIWKTIENQNKKEKILNFVRFVNLTFDVVCMSDDSMRIVSPKSAWVYVTYSEQGSMDLQGTDMRNFFLLISLCEFILCGINMCGICIGLVVSAVFIFWEQSS
ncbi:hypothetical protein GLOIN_2v1704883, partial [Rhizophagus irregularis DAOM 181602=DAOM 197198]